MYTPSSPEEREFLARYNPNKYKKPSVAVDTALYGYDPEEKKLKALLIRRGGFPYRGCWAFPGGFLNMEEHIHAAAARELQEETGIRMYMPICIMSWARPTGIPGTGLSRRSTFLW